MADIVTLWSTAIFVFDTIPLILIGGTSKKSLTPLLFASTIEAELVADR